MRQYKRLTLLILTALVSLNEATTTHPPPEFSIPDNAGLDLVNMLIGNGGDTPNGSGGMIPSTAPPFGMTRWVAQTQPHYVSATPYNWTLNKVMGVVGTRQPAIWMGESAPISVVPGVGPNVVVDFEERGLEVLRGSDGQKNEVVSSGYYSVELDDGHGGSITIEQTATSRVAHLRFTFDSTLSPYVLFEVSRPSVITSTPTNITFPIGSVSIPDDLEVCGWSDEREDSIIAPISTAPFSKHFKGYFCARFDKGTPKPIYGVIQNDTVSFPHPQHKVSQGPLLSAYAQFPQSKTKTVITMRVGTSFISEDQARKNIDAEIPDSSPSSAADAHLIPGTFQNTAFQVRKSWADILSRVDLKVYIDENSNKGSPRDFVDQQAFWTAIVHTLQYPTEQHEQGQYYSGYDNAVHVLEEGGESYTGYSIWDTFRAEWAWQILFVPDRIPGFVQSMLADYQESGWLPMWKNIVETNIMVGTHADSLVAEAVLKNITGFDRELAWEAVWKDATVPPENDLTTVYADREEHVDYEVRAGLSSSYAQNGWVADDIHSESASRTLDYAYDDYAAYVLARELGKPENVTNFLLERAMRAPFTLFNDATGFMEARNADGSWAGDDNGWTEGDKWAYSFDVVHDIPTLIERRGGNVKFVQSLDDHFNGGHNDHSNEPSHHIPYLYALAGAAYKTQEKVREIAVANYNNTPEGLSGNEDCGQMSAWYIFSAMGFYPVNPVSGEYVVGSPFFERITIDLNSPASSSQLSPKLLTVTAIGARTKQYIKSLKINGVDVDQPIIKHEQIAQGADIVFEMSDEIQGWGNNEAILKAFGVGNETSGAPHEKVSIPGDSEPSSERNADASLRDEL
ncbi:putative glycosidase [Psilocybe cubensis]|uniref:Glycoside hydrolase family 92 protein n=2 Tax=Psilocybe cubensis TaxID=181762 RepID=A0A8H8CE91_PSICU|nr:putative glycosidase [Psilocybe cubensis]KAH9483275.1 putative glycosidase [Psilocybe cubensis]